MDILPLHFFVAQFWGICFYILKYLQEYTFINNKLRIISAKKNTLNGNNKESFSEYSIIKCTEDIQWIQIDNFNIWKAVF